MVATKTAAPPKENSGRGIQQRSMPFVGLLFLPVVALAGGLAVHLSVRESVTGIGLTAASLGAITTALGLLAYLLGTHRDPVVAWHVVITVVATGLGEAVTVVVGPHRWWATAFMIGGEVVSCSWALHRIDALRRDPKGDQPAEDTLTKKLGLENTRFGKPKHVVDKDGEVSRIEVPVTHGPGETVDVIQKAVPGIESLADAPRGRSRAVPTEGAGKSQLVIITKDVLKDLIEYPGPSSPGGCITEPLVTAQAEDQQLGKVFIAGGQPEAPNPSSSGWMGMTRTGKTMNAQVRSMEKMSRRNVALMWFDTVKGAQTVRPLRRGLDIIVASDDPKAFRAGMKALISLIKWRANRLGECGYRSWTPEAAVDPRLRMPFLVPHFEEADALTDIAGDEMVFIASKGLSVGVSMGISLQRADNTSMPTGLRFNIGNWSCFGCGDDYSAGFALSDFTIDAGAHPENWKQSKPGYHYTEGVGIPDERWAVPLKSMFASDQQMEAHAEVWGPRMMPLDEGSIKALGAWYELAKRETVELVAQWDAGPAAGIEVHDGTTTTETAVSSTNTGDDDEMDADRQWVQQEMADMVNNGELEPHADEEAGKIDIRKSVPPPTADQELSWEDDRPPAPSREAAVDAFVKALVELVDDDHLTDPDESESVLIGPALLADRYGFRSRPWFSEILTKAAEGELELPGLSLTRTDRAGTYRLQRVRT